MWFTNARNPDRSGLKGPVLSARNHLVARSAVRAEGGNALPPSVRSPFEAGLGADFSHVRVHTDEAADAAARSAGASALTIGRDVHFRAGTYAPGSPTGRQLLAHEFAHVVQQEGAVRRAGQLAVDEVGTAGADVESEAETAAAALSLGGRVPPLRPAPVAVARQQHRTLRSPVFEETVTQLSDVSAQLLGRPLSETETALVRPVFGSSIDYSRVRLLPTGVLEYRTVGNVIRLPEDFTVSHPNMAQTLIHEMTHVWQYQHGGTSYISLSLGAQIVASLTRGNRNFAYDYHLTPRSSFFDFSPEQQASIVENYHSMLRDRAEIVAGRTTGRMRSSYDSNHLGPDGFPMELSPAQRLAEITDELPLHEPLLKQLQAAVPRPELELLFDRAREVMQPPPGIPPGRAELQPLPIKPVLEVRWP